VVSNWEYHSYCHPSSVFPAKEEPLKVREHLDAEIPIVLPEISACRGPLQDWPFDVPFPPRISPERERVTEHSRIWVQRMGLRSNPAELRQHDRYDMPLFVCLSYPDATGPELDLISDWVCWWAIWNDLTDDPGFLNNPHEVNRFFSSLAAVVASPDAASDRDLPAQPDSFVAAFVDLWQRWRHGMSPTYIARTGKNWMNWFNSWITENHNRRNAVTLDVPSYHELRDVTGAVDLELDGAERVGHYEVPPGILASRIIHDMRQITIRVINITQDVQSLPKEEKAGDQHNLVLVLEREQSCTREQALREVHTMIRRWTDAFLTHEAAVPRLLDQLALPLTERWPVYKHVADMRTMMKGGVDFCAASGRYAQPHTDTNTGTGHSHPAF